MKLQLARAQALLNQTKPKPDEAMKVLQPLVKRKNAPWPVFHYSGIAFIQKKDYATALSFLNESIKQGADEAETYHSISICYFNLGNYELAEENEQIALDRRSDFFKGWLHLGSIYRAQARLEEALKCYQKANKLDPKSSGIAYRIAEIYNDQGDLNKALELYQITVKMDPEYYEAYLAMSQVLRKQHKYAEAEECIYKVLKDEPKHMAARVELGEHLKYAGNYEKAIEMYEKMICEFPKVGGIRVNYALCLQELGRFDESEEHYMIAFRDHPETFEPLTNYLMGVHYNPERTKQEIFEAHKLWDQNFAPKERPQRPVPFDTSKEKKLRLGFISGGFRAHPVGWMITKALENLPSDRFEVYCYTTNNSYDRITRRIHAATDKWQSVIGYNDQVIAGMIKKDEIDILVELSGHSADTRLKTVVLEPAPVIVKWVGGLFNTTGLKSVDYLLTDHHETPKGEEKFYTEKLIRMPDDYICFLPPDYAPEVGQLPLQKNGYVTFGCFNNPTKVNDQILVKWAQIMNRVPESRLFLKSKQYDTVALRERIINTMKKNGIEEDRLRFEGLSPHDELLDKYNEVDIALDPWPYSGGLTTCEALWMGVPVVTKPGPTFAGRHSTTHLINAGLPDLVVDTWEAYVDKTVELASNREKLGELRSGLRKQIADSPLVDGPKFGAHFAKAMRSAWHQWVNGFENGVEDWQDHIDVDALDDQQIERMSQPSKPSENVQGILDHIENEMNGTASADATELADPAPTNENNKNGSVRTNGAVNSSEAREEQPDVYKIETTDGVTICTPPDPKMMTPYVLLEQKQWYENELDFVRDYLKPGMTVLDVGAGFGAYSLPAAKLVSEEGRVFAFEPGSVAKHHLEMSKLENGFQNLDVVGKAVSAKNGKHAWKIADTPELNRLDESGEETVSTVTIDAWWQFEGEPNIDLLKIDVNGVENDVLEGATKVLKNESPVLLISITEQKADAFGDELKSLGYSLFEYIPGPGILAEHDMDAGADPYMQNLIAIQERQIGEFKKEGWLHDESVKTIEIEKDLWKTELNKLPWTHELMEQWKNHDNSEGIKSYLQALNYLIAAGQIDAKDSEVDQPRSQKAGLLLGAAQILIQLYNQGANSTSIVFTLVRTLNALGKRDQAVQVMQKLIENTKLGQENMNVDLPFMLPIPEQDNASIKTDLNKWLMVRTVEAWILLKDLTTYLSGPQELKLLEVLEGNVEVMDSVKIYPRMGSRGDFASKKMDEVKTKNILFITTDFPPYDGGRVGHSIRAYTLANFFAENGYKVHLLILQKMVADREVPYMHDNIRIINYDFHYNKKINIGLKVEDFCEKIIIQHNIERLVTSSPPLTSHLIALKLKERFKDKIYWISDFRDFIHIHPVTRSKEPEKHKQQKKTECEIMRTADAAITVSTGMQKIATQLYDELGEQYDAAKFEIIENGYIEHKIVPAQKEVVSFINQAKKNGKIILYYAGTGSIAGKQKFDSVYKDLTFIFDVFKRNLELAKHFALVIQGKLQLNQNYLDTLNGNLEYQIFEPAENEVIHANLKHADIGLSVNSDKVATPYIMGGKLYDYAYAGLALFLVYPNNPHSLREFSKKNGDKAFFANVFNAISVESTLQSILAKKEKLGSYKFSKEEIKPYSRNAQYQKFLGLLETNNESKKTKYETPRFIHFCYNTIYAQSLADLIEYVNENSDQTHELYVDNEVVVPGFNVNLIGKKYSHFFDSKKDLNRLQIYVLDESVQAVFMHGLFRKWQFRMLWALGSKKHVSWVIWGNDLYSHIKQNPKVFPAHKIKSINSAFKGDRDLFKKYFNEIPDYEFGYPIPGLYNRFGNNADPEKSDIIIVGNSLDPSNNHIEILNELASKEDIANYKIILPVSYGNYPEYKSKLTEFISTLAIKDNIELYEQFLAPDEYAELISNSKILIMAHHRQKAMGNIVASLYFGNATFFRKKITIKDGVQTVNSGWTTLEADGIIPYDYEDLFTYERIADIEFYSSEKVEEIRQTITDRYSIENKSWQLVKACEAIIESNRKQNNA